MLYNIILASDVRSLPKKSAQGLPPTAVMKGMTAIKPQTKPKPKERRRVAQ